VRTEKLRYLEEVSYRNASDACRDETLTQFSKHHKVIEAITARRFVRLVIDKDGLINELWVFIGKERDYILIPCLYCSCPDFTINVLSKGVKKFCYHLVALEIARRSNAYKELEVEPNDLVKIVLEIVINNFSSYLRRLLYRT